MRIPLLAECIGMAQSFVKVKALEGGEVLRLGEGGRSWS